MKRESVKHLLKALCLFIILPFTGMSQGYYDDTSRIMSWIETGIRLRNQKGDSSGLDYFQKALQVSKEINYTKGITLSHLHIGGEHDLNGKYKEARKCYMLSLNTIGKNKNNAYTAEIYICLGGTYAQEGLYEQAVDYYYKAVQQAEKQFIQQRKADSSGSIYISTMSRAYSQLSVLMNLMRQADRVLEYSDKAVQLAKASGDTSSLAKALIDRTLYFSRLGQMTEIKTLCNTVLAMSDTHNIYWHKQRAIRMLGDAFTKENPAKASTYYNKAIKLASRYPYQALHVMQALGALYAQQKRYRDAEQTLKEAEHIAVNLQQRHHVAGIYIALADLYAEQKQYEKAYYREDAFLFIYDSLIKAERDGKINALEIKYKTAEKDRAIAHNKLLLAQQQNKLIRNNTWIGVIITGMILMVIVFVAFYFHKRRIYTERIRLLKQKEEVNTLLAIIKGEEQERSRLGRELHDGIGGLLATTRMFFGNLQKKEPVLTGLSDYNEAIHLLDETITEVRKTAHNLMPELLFMLGLPEAVRAFCSRVQKINSIRINFQYFGFIDRLNGDFELFIYRTIQELLQNTIKHASATEVLVQLSMHDTTLSITVEDNGIGFDTESTAGNGVGLQLIKSRVKELNGQLNISSATGKGTSVYIELDIEEQQNSLS